MVGFASSIWLWTLAGLAIPIAIHLWNVRKGRTKKVGSVMLFSETAVSRARSVQITDVLRLFIRCLLFALIAGFIARPFIVTETQADGKGWLLIDRDEMSGIYRDHGNEIDSLLSTGVQLREFAPDFSSMKLSDTGRAKKQYAGSYWERLSELQHKIPPGLPVYLYTGNSLKRFEGERPGLAINLHWKTVITKDSASWIVQAYRGSHDSIVLVTGHSGALGTRYETISIAMSDSRLMGDSVSLNGQVAAIDTSSLTVGIFGDPGEKDAAYLSAAIDAFAESSKMRIAKQMVNGAPSQKFDWLFWLSNKEMPEGISADHLFRYGGSLEIRTSSFFSIDDGSDPIPVYRLRTATGHVRNAWFTSEGDPILRLDPEKQYVFYSRFDPAWNEWVWQDNFPAFIAELFVSRQQAGGTDHRMIDKGQILPVQVQGEQRVGSVKEDISHHLWLIALVLFLLERLMVYRKQKSAHG